MLSIIDKYILKKFLGTFIFSISLILSIFIVFDIKDKIQTFSTKKIPLYEIIIDYYCMFVPVYANFFSPLFVFISIIFFTAKMANQTEFVAILSSGAGFKRILKPYLIGAFIIGFFSLLMNHFVIPKAQKVKIGFEDKWINNGYSTNAKNIHKTIAPNTILYLASYDNHVDEGYKVSMEKFANNVQTYMLKAESMKWDSVQKLWILKDAFERRITEQDHLDTLKNTKPVFVEQHTFYPTKTLKIDFTPSTAEEIEMAGVMNPSANKVAQPSNAGYIIHFSFRSFNKANNSFIRSSTLFSLNSLAFITLPSAQQILF